jgi:broad specificity phosphatase PhoE
VTTLILVRHGQASFGSSNYDRLSSLGARQSRVLGEYWARLKFSFDAVYSGDMTRQKSTAEHVLAGMNASSAGVLTSAALNEYEFEAILRAYIPQVAREQPQLGIERGGLYNNPKLFQTAFDGAIQKWLLNHPHEHPPFESWQDFHTRCRSGFAEIASAERKCVVAFTSGGVIAVALREALGLSDEVTLRQNWRIYNGSVHAFRMGRSGLTLLGYNNVAHFELSGDKELITFR